MKVLAFDIGIRNLAWCLIESGDATGKKPTILGWQNYDLLAGSGTEEAKAAAKVKCSVCLKSLATFQNPSGHTCQRHCPATHPPLKDVSGTVLKRLPALGALRTLVAAKGLPVPKRATKAQLVAALATVHALPLEKLKVKKAVETDMMRMHDAIRSFVGEKAELFRQATHVLLENQPVLKNPTMKTVQILLFATLRDILQVQGQIYRLVHAGKKVAVEATGDAGYKDRKNASEAKVEGILKADKVTRATGLREEFLANSKRSDLADAFCMCWDAIAAAAP